MATLGHKFGEHFMMSLEATATASEAITVVNLGELAERRLRRSSYFALSTIGCTYREGVLTLRGHLPTHYLKQMAQETVGGLEGVHAIANQIEVRSPISK